MPVRYDGPTVWSRDDVERVCPFCGGTAYLLPEGLFKCEVCLETFQSVPGWYKILRNR